MKALPPLPKYHYSWGLNAGREDFLTAQKRDLRYEYAGEGGGKKLKIIPLTGYELVEYFILDTATWYEDYYDPLQELITGTKNRDIHNAGLKQALESQQSEVTMVKQNPERCTSAFFVLRKPE